MNFSLRASERSRRTTTADVPPRAVAWKVVFVYVAMAAIWIVFSDRALAVLFPSASQLSRWQTVKGLAFVGCTGLLLGALVRHYVRRLMASHAAVGRRERHFRALYENAPVASQMVNAEGRICDVNRAWTRLMGYSREEAIGRAFGEFVVSGLCSCLARPGAPAAASCESGEGELELRTKAGGVVSVAADCRVSDEDGVTTGEVQCALHDITERKKAEREIERLNRLYTVLSQVNQTIVRAQSREEVFERVCCAAVQHGRFKIAWVGWLDPETRAVRPVAQCGDDGDFLPHIQVFADDRPEGGGPTGTALRERRTAVCNDFAGSPANGPWLAAAKRAGIASAASFPIRVGNDVCGALVLYATEPGFFREREVLLLEEAASDVSFALTTLENEARRRSAEAALSEREARLASVFRAVPVGICVVVNRVFTEVNKAMCDITGFASEDLVGHSTRILYRNGGEFEDVGRAIYAEIAARGVASGEARWRRHDGREIDILLSAAAIVPGDLAAGVTFAVLDVTEKRRLEAQLRQAQKMEAVGELAGGVAHDFNNILTALLLQLELLQRTPQLAPAVVESLRELEQHGRRAAGLTRQLLLFSRRQVMQMRPLDLNELLDNMLKMLRRLLGENIVIEFRSHTGLPRIEGDAGMVEQVVVNLCVNARDAMPQGGRLHIGAEPIAVDEEHTRRNPAAHSGSFLRLSVADTGCGMDEATMAHIFEPFFTTKEVGKGTGLGLATVFGIVQQHQGWIEVESAIGKGTTFAVYLPVSERSGADDPDAALAAAPLQRGQETILLVEDETPVRRLMASFLRRQGYQVIEATDGADALEQWKHTPTRIHLLVSDMVMPGGLTGLDLARRLKAETGDLKVIIVSGYSADLLRYRDAIARDFAFVAKPCDARQLSRTVREVLDSVVSIEKR